MRFKKNKWFTSILLVVILVLLLGSIGVYYLLKQNPQQDKGSFNRTESTLANTQKPTTGQEYFSCLQVGGNNTLNKADPYEKGSLVFKAKEGTSEEVILNKLKPLGYDSKTVNSAWGYSGIARSTLFIKHPLTPDNIKRLITPIVSKYQLEEKSTGFYYSTAHILFTRLLDKNEQESINKQLSNLKSQGSIIEFSWNFAPKQLYGFLAAPAGREEEYIEKLNQLGIFDCVSKKLNTTPYMPGPQ